MRLYWAPQTRSLRALWMLEEIGAPYERVLVDLKTASSTGRRTTPSTRWRKCRRCRTATPAWRNPARSSPYLAEKFPQAGLAPAIGEPTRGRYLQWLFFSGSCIEAAITQKFANVQLPEGSAGWGSFDKVFNVLAEVLVRAAPICLGDNFSAADVLIASDLHFVIDVFKMLEPRPEFSAYLERCRSRPAFSARAKNRRPMGSEAAVLLGVESSVLGRPWRDRLDAAGDARALAIAQQTGLPDLLSRVLAGRGVGPETALAHLDPTLRALLPEPFSAHRDAGGDRAAGPRGRAAGNHRVFSAITMSTAPVPRRCWRNFSIIAASRA